MALEKDLVGRLPAFLAVEEVVEGHFVERGGRGVGRDVPADAVALLVRADHHRHRVPADDVLDAPLDVAVAGIGRLVAERNRVDVGRRHARRILHAAQEGVLLQPHEQIRRPPRAALGDHIIHRLDPFGRLVGVRVLPQREQALGQQMVKLARVPFLRFHPVLISVLCDGYLRSKQGPEIV